MADFTHLALNGMLPILLVDKANDEFINLSAEHSVFRLTRL
jgi:hypothetical protein